MANTTINNLATTTLAANLTSSHYLVLDDGTTTSKIQALSCLLKAANPATTGAEVIKSIASGTLNYRALKATSPLTVTQNTNDVTFGFDESSLNLNNMAGIANFDLSQADNSSSLFLSSVNLASNVTGTLPVANGGTGKTSFSTSSVLLGGTTIREATLNSDLKVVVGTTSGPEVKTLQGDSDRITVTQNNSADTVTVAFDDTNIVTSGADATLGDVTVNALTIGSLSTSAGGTVTQTTSLSTGVTLNAIGGTITLYTAAIVADTNTQFVVTNNLVSSTSVIFLSKEFQSDTAANNGVHVSIASVADGNFTINITHTGNQNAAAITRKIHFFVFG